MSAASLIQQFLTSFRETDTPEPGLIRKNDGTVWLVNPDGTSFPIGPQSLLGSGQIVVPIGGTNGIAISPDGKTVYAVITTPDGFLVPIDVRSLFPGASIPVGNGPEGVAITPDGTKAYVCNTEDGTVTPIDLTTQTPGDPIDLATSTPSLIAITPDGAKAYVTNADGHLSVIDTGTDTVSATISVSSSLYGIAITPDGKTVYVSNNETTVVFPVDVATGIPGSPITVGGRPIAMAITADGKTMWVANFADGTVVAVALPSHVVGAPISIGDGPEGLVLSVDERTLYVSASEDNAVTPVDIQSATAGDDIATVAGPEYLVVTPDGKFLFATLPGGTGVQVLNAATNSPISPVPLDVIWVGDLAVVSGTQDPTTITMTFVLPGSLYLRSDGSAWWRTGTDIGDWTQIGGGGGGGGLALTGWSEDSGNPADVATNGGALDLGDGNVHAQDGTGNVAGIEPSGTVFVNGAAGDLYVIQAGVGITSQPPPDIAAFTAFSENGGTVAMDAGGLSIINLPTSDPHIASALWNNAGTPAISAG